MGWVPLAVEQHLHPHALLRPQAGGAGRDTEAGLKRRRAAPLAARRVHVDQHVFHRHALATSPSCLRRGNHRRRDQQRSQGRKRNHFWKTFFSLLTPSVSGGEKTLLERGDDGRRAVRTVYTSPLPLLLAPAFCAPPDGVRLLSTIQKVQVVQTKEALALALFKFFYLVCLTWHGAGNRFGGGGLTTWQTYCILRGGRSLDTDGVKCLSRSIPLDHRPRCLTPHTAKPKPARPGASKDTGQNPVLFVQEGALGDGERP